MINEKIWKPWQLGRTQAMFRKYMKRKETQYEKDKKDALTAVQKWTEVTRNEHKTNNII